MIQTLQQLPQDSAVSLTISGAKHYLKTLCTVDPCQPSSNFSARGKVWIRRTAWAMFTWSCNLFAYQKT